MSDWKSANIEVSNNFFVARFDELVELRHGYQFRNYDFTTSGVKVFKITQIQQDGSIDISSCDFIQQSRIRDFERVIIKNGDILMALTGATIGKIARYTKDEVVLQNYRVGIFFSRDESKLSKDYLFYFLKSRFFISQLLARQTQSAQQNIGKEEISNMTISFPDIKTQQRIASILSALDDKIELNRQMNQTLEEMALAMFKHYFVDGIDIDNLPDGWTLGRFEDYFEVVKGLSYKGSGLCIKGQGIPMYNLNSVFEGGGYKAEGIKYYNGEYKERHLINPWDIIVTNTEQGHNHLLIGYPAVVPSYMSSPGIFTHHIFKLSIKNDFITSQFLYYLVLQPTIRDQIISCTNGTTVNMLSADGLKIPEFIVPPKVVIDGFSEPVANFWKMKESNYLESEYLKETRDYLLPKLLSGEVIPSDLEQLEHAI